MRDNIRSDSEYYHYAAVVEDIHKSIKMYQEAAGLAFTEVRDFEFKVEVDGEQRSTHFLAVYSKGGPPYLELVQEVSGDTWGPTGLNLAHVGFFVTDILEAASRFEELGCTLRVKFPGSPPSIVYLATPDGTWIELVGPEVRAIWTEWQETTYKPRSTDESGGVSTP
jgi:catechol 2,3-dioxygenase-like lactoylglutathione lyase family enzyme